MIQRTTVAIALLGFGGLCTGAFADPVTVDTSCNPTVDPPSAGGCTWNNFYESAATGAPFGTGSSFSGYYVAAGTDPWTIADTTDYFLLRVLDGGHQGDTFEVFDNSVELGTTSSTTVNLNHTCANDPTDSIAGVSPGSDPASCWSDPLMSQGSFELAPNPSGHSIEILWDQEITGGDSSLQWFEVNTATASQFSGVPEPGTLALFGIALPTFVFLRRRVQKYRS